MLLATKAKCVVATDVELGSVEHLVCERRFMSPNRFGGHLVEADTGDHGRCAGKVCLDEPVTQPYGIEDLGAAVRLEGRDTHLRHHLEYPFVDGFYVVQFRFVVGGISGEIFYHCMDTVESKVRVDRLGAVAAEQAEIMHLSGLAGLNDEPHLGSQTCIDQVVMNRCGGEQGRDGDSIYIQMTVRQNEDVVARRNRLGGPFAELHQGCLHTLCTLMCRVANAQLTGSEGIVDVVLNAADTLQVHVGEDRVGDLEPFVGTAGIEIEQVGAGPDQRHHRHHRLFSDRIDGRIRDLGEPLLEVVIQHLGAVGKDCGRCVPAHRPDRVLPTGRHRFEEELDVFPGIAESLLGGGQSVGIWAHGCHFRRQFSDMDLRLVEPPLIGLFSRQRVLEFSVVDDATLFEIDEQHLARLKAPLLHNLLFRNVEHAHLRRHHHQVVISDEVAGRAKPVSVKSCADLPAVGEGHGRRPVPGLHQSSVVLVERLASRVHQRVVRPRFRDHQHHGVTERIPTGQQQLECIVECRGVR